MPKMKKERTIFIAHFHNVFRPHPLTPFDLCPKFLSQMKDLMKVRKPNKFFKDSFLQFWFSF